MKYLLYSNSQQGIVRFFSYFKKYKERIIVALICVPISIAAAFIAPFLSIIIVDNYIAKGVTEGIHLVIMAYAVVFVAGYSADTVYYYMLQKSGAFALSDMRRDLFGHVVNLPRTYFDKTPHGITLSRLTTDFEAIGESLSMGVVNLIIELIKAVVLCGLLIYISLKLSVVFALVVPVIFLVSYLIRRQLKTYYGRSRAALAESISFLNECLQGMRTVLLLNATTNMEKSYAQKNDKFYQPRKAANFYESLLFSVIEGVSMITVAIVLWVGANQIVAGVLTIGTLIAFYQTMQKIFLPIRELTQQLSSIQRATTSMVSIDKLFKAKQDKDQASKGATLKRFDFLEFRNVSFRYGPDKPLVLKEVSFRLNREEKLAFVGRTGSGKTSILKLIDKQYQGYEGEIILNGQELSSLSKKEVLSFLSIMNQDVFLFNETIRFNIALSYNKDKLSDIQRAVDYVQADKFIDKLPLGLEHGVLENGKNLSLGQSQMLGLARAYARDKDVFIFDEATAAIDSITENYIEQALKKIFNEKTAIIVAHRLGTIKNADQIIVLDNGMVKERGTHQELIDLKGSYFNLSQVEARVTQ
ncbi:MAG: ABC transporter ATP-binding protein [SAR324 cluster bacterium]|nr:ABC transporter ATP-binding protein [SAR324 cluster bacterium]